MTPKSGGRAVLDFIGEDERTVRYQAALYTPEATFTSEATIARDGGAVSFGAWSAGEPPAWLVKYAQTFLRSAFRDHAKDPSVPWIARVNRWREEKE